MPKSKFTRPVKEIDFPIGPSIAYVPLSKGLFALIDAEDADWVGQWNWCASQSTNRRIYAMRRQTMSDGKYTTIYLHNQVLLPDRGYTADHVYSPSSLDNRRANLRPATRSEQCANQQRRFDNTSGAKGVSWYKPTRKWAVQITFRGKGGRIGYFDTIEDAKTAYANAAAKLFGEFARIE